MSFTAPGSPNEVRSYCVDQFKQKAVEAPLAGDAARQDEGWHPFTIKVGAAPSGSNGTIVVQSKD